MKDSLIGSYGASALIVVFALRIGTLATLSDRLHPLEAAMVVVVAASLSRTAGLMPLALLPAARRDGASYAVGQPTRDGLRLAAFLAVVLALVLGGASAWPPAGIALMLVLAAFVASTLTRLSARLIGGQTGDVAGAIQQLAEVAAMIGLLITVEP
jgi:adenosylcobinamide-GDP ribazoletransferase